MRARARNTLLLVLPALLVSLPAFAGQAAADSSSLAISVAERLQPRPSMLGVLPSGAAAALLARAPASPSPGPVPAPPRLPRRAALEIGAVAATGFGHLAFRAIDASPVFIPLASVSWGTYVVMRARADSSFFRDVGLGKAGLGPAFRAASLVALGGTALMAGVAAAQGSLELHPDLLPLLVLYPAWGTVQQFLVQGLVARNLADAGGWLGSPYLVVPVSALLFGAVHLPDWKLTAATSGLGLAFTPIYLEHRNVWPLGLYHGLLGALFYFWVLGENPWRELTG